jgi:hypothetical protein
MKRSSSSQASAEPQDTRKGTPPYFFSADEFDTLRAFAARIIPTGEDPYKDPGANEIGTSNYVDSWILDESESTQDKFRKALAFIADTSRERFGATFIEIAPSKQNEFLSWMIKDRVGLNYFETLRSSCIEGFYSDYCDPDYRGPTAWTLVGYQGKRISDLKKAWSFLRIYEEKSREDLAK